MTLSGFGSYQSFAELACASYYYFGPGQLAWIFDSSSLAGRCVNGIWRPFPVFAAALRPQILIRLILTLQQSFA